jgi:hypothetical protein
MDACVMYGFITSGSFAYLFITHNHEEAHEGRRHVLAHLAPHVQENSQQRENLNRIYGEMTNLLFGCWLILDNKLTKTWYQNLV